MTRARGLLALAFLAFGATMMDGPAAPPSAAAASAPASATVQPTTGSHNMLDCNGWSPAYPSLVPAMKMRCVDPIGSYDGKPAKFYDNGHYVGHDEPTVKFISTVSGSGNSMTYLQQLATDPVAPPTTSPSGTTVSNYAELSPAPWFGLPICDPKSFPNGSCTPISDSNAPQSSTNAGSAFLELQFYPPAYGPWLDGISFDQTKWTVALNIDSLECAGTDSTGCTTPNLNCVEPVNFALLTHDGVPTGPPSPQSASGATFSENSDTLKMNPGDVTRVTFSDVPDAGSPSTGGLRVEVDDFTTGQSGFIISSAANGFRDTSRSNCAGTLFSFHALYSTAAQGNQVDWAALEGGVLMDDEIGHFEPCAGISSADAVSISADSFSDPAVKQVCTGPFEAQNGGSSTGEGPCPASGPTVTNCPGATTEGSTATACPAFSPANSCEQGDGYCIPSGSRSVTVNGAPTLWNWPVSGCQDNQFQNGDLDFDGSSYIADWPDGTANHPASFRYLGPFDTTGSQYANVQFETDAPGSEQSCTGSAKTKCVVPPAGASFYPFWSMTNSQGLTGITTTPGSPCVWNFGNDISGVTTNDFSKDAQYGNDSSSTYFGTDISAVTANPAINGTCPTVTYTPPPPAVTAINPSQGSSLGGATVTVSGSGLTGASAVHFGSSLGSNVTVVSDSRLTALSPPGTGTVDVTVTTTSGTSATSGADLFTYVIPTYQTQSAVSTKQFTLADSDGSTWQPISCALGPTTCSSKGSGTVVSVTLVPTSDGTAVLSGNADLWTWNAGVNQDIGIFVNGSLVAWKESGGSAGTFSPNAAFVQTSIPVIHGVGYTIDLVWKTNNPAAGKQISAGAGPIGTDYSPTGLTAVVLPASQVSSSVSTKQFTLANSNGSTWQPMSCISGPTTCSSTGSGTGDSVTLSPGIDGEAMLSGNADLWTWNAGVNQDIGIFVNGSLVAWKESGGSAGTFSPNAAFVQTSIPITHGVIYTIDLRWKANTNATGKQISAGAGPIGSNYSPTGLVAAVVPAGANPYTAASTKQYTLANSDGTTWQPMGCSGATTCSSAGSGGLSMTVTPSQTCTAVLSANADLWTWNGGLNQDIAIFVNGSLVAWKESGGSAGTFSPNAAFVQSTTTLTAATPYTIDVRWKTNVNAAGKQISSGAGPIGGNYSPSTLTALLTSCP
jgi:IPT/TIG domain